MGFYQEINSWIHLCLDDTNFGIKSHSAGVKPTMYMDKSAYKNYMKKNKKWSSLHTLFTKPTSSTNMPQRTPTN